MSSIEEVKQLQIPLQHISKATNEFADANLIGKGGFGNVYKGVSGKHGRIAVKRLDPRQRQGEREFRIEIALLSKYKHENIVSLLGFCDEDGEKILVYKYESKGSLDKHVESKDLNWIQRLKICLDVARGLKYLHDDVGSQHRILHRDIKSSNVLLNKNWKAKISDFGLSRDFSASSFVISDPCGTHGYIDPYYCTNGHLSQKTDVFSFGVVLCEVLCGRLAHVTYKDERETLSMLFEKHYKKRTLHRIIPSDLQKEISACSLATFSDIAYQCLRTVQERPEMNHVVEQLEEALHNQLEVKRAKEETKPAIRDEKTNCKTKKVVVKREKSDQLKFLEGAQKESHQSVKLSSTIEKEEPSKQKNKKDEEVKRAKEEAKPAIRDEKTNCKTKKVVVNREKSDQLKFLEGAQKESHQSVKLSSTIVGRGSELKKLEKEEPSKQKNKKDEEGKRADEEAKPVTSSEEKGDKSKDPQPPPPSQEVVLKIFMHCENCAKQVRQCLIGFKGVEDVVTNPETHKVIVKGNNIDPLKVCERVQKKMDRKVELLLSVPKPPADPKLKEKKHEHPSMITSILKIRMDCKGCVQEIKKCITKMKGVESVVPDPNNSQVVVKGTVEAAELVDQVHKKTNKKAVILRQDPEPKKKEAESSKHELQGR